MESSNQADTIRKVVQEKMMEFLEMDRSGYDDVRMCQEMKQMENAIKYEVFDLLAIKQTP